MGKQHTPTAGIVFIVGIVEKYIRFGWDGLDFLSRLTARTIVSRRRRRRLNFRVSVQICAHPWEIICPLITLIYTESRALILLAVGRNLNYLN